MHLGAAVESMMQVKSSSEPLLGVYGTHVPDENALRSTNCGSAARDALATVDRTRVIYAVQFVFAVVYLIQAGNAKEGHVQHQILFTTLILISGSFLMERWLRHHMTVYGYLCEGGV